MDITEDNNIAPVDGKYLMPGGLPFPMATLTTMCESITASSGTSCSHFNSCGSVKTWTYNPAVQSFLSNTTCGNQGGGVPVVMGGTALSPPGALYFYCSGGSINLDTTLTAFASFELPPFLVEQACDKNPQCVGFVTDSAGTKGSLLQYNESTNPGDACTGVFRIA